MARSQRAQLGGVHAGARSARVAVHVDLPARLSARVPMPTRDRHAQQIERAMALADGACARLADGTIAYAGHRRIRDGARAALILIPELLRFDVHPRRDSFSFNVRSLSSLPATGDARQPMRPHHHRDGAPPNEFEVEIATPQGHDVCIVFRVPPYLGALENDYSAIALIR